MNPQVSFLFCFVISTLPAIADGTAAPDKQIIPALQQAFESASTQIKMVPDGGFTADNPRHGFSISFSSLAPIISSAEGKFSLKLIAYGRGNRLQSPPSAHLSAQGNRIEYLRGPLTEWYVNDDRGLEQGFTLSVPQQGDGRVTLHMQVQGDLTPGLESDGVLILTRNGSPVLRYGGIQAWDSAGRALPAGLSIKGNTVTLDVDDAGAQYPLSVDPVLEQARLFPTTQVLNAYFGASVAISGDTALIGAWGENSLLGAAYIFVRSGKTWTQQARLALTTGSPNDCFGYTVALNGDTALISAHGDSGYRGAAYVFVRSGATWTQQAKLTASDGLASDFFGQKLALDANTAIVTAHGDDFSRGSAYVFVNSGGVWSQQAKLTASDGVASDWFGSATSISGDTVVVGAFEKSSWRGGAYVFVRSGATWTQQANLSADDGIAFDQFGYAAAVSGDTVMVGATCANSCQGATYVYTRTGSAWTQSAKLAVPGAVSFGTAISLDGETALIGAPCSGTCNGAAFVYTLTGSTWNQRAGFKESHPQMDASYGAAVALSGGAAIIGAWGDDIFLGAAYVQGVPPSCSLKLTLSYSAGSLTVAYTVSTTQTALSTGKIYINNSPKQLWQKVVGPIVPISSGSFALPLPPVGQISVLTTLVPQSGDVCYDWPTIDTGQ